MNNLKLQATIDMLILALNDIMAVRESPQHVSYLVLRALMNVSEFKK